MHCIQTIHFKDQFGALVLVKLINLVIITLLSLQYLIKSILLYCSRNKKVQSYTYNNLYVEFYQKNFVQ